MIKKPALFQLITQQTLYWEIKVLLWSHSAHEVNNLREGSVIFDLGIPKSAEEEVNKQNLDSLGAELGVKVLG